MLKLLTHLKCYNHHEVREIRAPALHAARKRLLATTQPTQQSAYIYPFRRDISVEPNKNSVLWASTSKWLLVLLLLQAERRRGRSSSSGDRVPTSSLFCLLILVDCFVHSPQRLLSDFFYRSGASKQGWNNSMKEKGSARSKHYRKYDDYYYIIYTH